MLLPNRHQRGKLFEAEPPHYDEANHKIYWAKELRFGDKTNHTLNYGIRALGRQGVLELNAVAGMSDLDAIKQRMPDMISMVEFNAGSRYADFTPGRDKVAEYGLALKRNPKRQPPFHLISSEEGQIGSASLLA